MKWILATMLAIVMLFGIALLGFAVYMSVVEGVESIAAGVPGFVLIVGSLLGSFILAEEI